MVAGDSAPRPSCVGRAVEIREHGHDDVAVLGERVEQALRDVVGVIDDELAGGGGLRQRAGQLRDRLERVVLARRASGTRSKPRERRRREAGAADAADRPHELVGGATGAREVRADQRAERLGRRRADRAPTRRAAGPRRGCRRARASRAGTPADEPARAERVRAGGARRVVLAGVRERRDQRGRDARVVDLRRARGTRASAPTSRRSSSALSSGATARRSPERPSVNVAASRIATSWWSISGSTSVEHLRIAEPARPRRARRRGPRDRAFSVSVPMCAARPSAAPGAPCGRAAPRRPCCRGGRAPATATRCCADVLLVAQRLEQRLQAVAADRASSSARAALLDLVAAVALALDEPRHVAQVERRRARAGRPACAPS